MLASVLTLLVHVDGAHVDGHNKTCEAGDVMLNEVHPAGNPDYIELANANTGQHRCSLEGWMLIKADKDELAQDGMDAVLERLLNCSDPSSCEPENRLVFGNVILDSKPYMSPGQKIVLAEQGGLLDNGQDSFGFDIGEEGETRIILRPPRQASDVIWAVTWVEIHPVEHRAGKSYQRCRDGTWGWSTATKDERNSCARTRASIWCSTECHAESSCACTAIAHEDIVHVADLRLEDLTWTELLAIIIMVMIIYIGARLVTALSGFRMSHSWSLFLISSLVVMAIAMNPSWFGFIWFYDCADAYMQSILGCGSILGRLLMIFVVGCPILATLAIISTYGCMHELGEFMKSFRKFVGEAVMKLAQPLGRGVFFPCKSGNWKGAVQQWLVIHLHQWTLISLALITTCLTKYGYLGFSKGTPFGLEFYSTLLVLNVFLTWHFWFALTQRKPKGFLASLFGIWIPIGLVGVSFPIVPLLLLEVPLRRIYGWGMWIFLSPEALFIPIPMALLVSTELCLVICFLKAIREEDSQEETKHGTSCDVQVRVCSTSGHPRLEEEIVGKPGGSKQTASTEAIDVENPTADSNHEQVHDQLYDKE